MLMPISEKLEASYCGCSEVSKESQELLVLKFDHLKTMFQWSKIIKSLSFQQSQNQFLGRSFGNRHKKNGSIQPWLLSNKIFSFSFSTSPSNVAKESIICDGCSIRIINQNRRQMQSRMASKARTLDNINFLISIGEFKLNLSLPKNTTVTGLTTIVKGYEALHQDYGPQGQNFVGLGSINCNPFVDYWLTQGGQDFMRFKKKLQLKAIYGSERRSQKISISQFQFLVCLGTGACGEVYLVRSKITGSVMALKRVRKDTLTNYNSLMTLFRERKSMVLMGNNPHTVTMHAAFQSLKHFNFLLDYCPGGELFLHLNSKRKDLNMNDIKHYFCEILLAMEYIHRKKVLYRDLKPENIFVDLNGHLKIGDFGMSKCNFEQDDFALSVCGSHEYMAPELMQNKQYNFSADFYSLGALLFEFLTGYPPYYKEDDQQLKLKLMKNMNLQLQKVTDDPMLQQLLVNLLHPDPDQRISNYQQIKNSPWLAKVDWKMVQSRNDVMIFAPDASGVYIGKEFLDLQHEVEEMNYYYEEEAFSSQISDAFEYIRPESKKILGLDMETHTSKMPKQKQPPRVDKKHSKKTNLSVALFDRDETLPESLSSVQVRTSKHIDSLKENKQNILTKCENIRGKGFSKNPNNILLVSKGNITINSQKSQRNLILNSHNNSDCSSKASKGSSRSKQIHFRGETSRNKANSKEKSVKQTSVTKMMKKQDKKTLLPTCSFKIKLT